MRTHSSICLGIPEICLPKPGTDLTRWAVIACDQYTSEPEYWQRAAEIVGSAPSTLNLIYPEVYLNELDPAARIAGIRRHMKEYWDAGLFREADGFVYVERQTGTQTRKGLVVCLDLEHYDFRKGSTEPDPGDRGDDPRAHSAPGPDPGGRAVRAPPHHGPHRRSGGHGHRAPAREPGPPRSPLRFRADDGLRDTSPAAASSDPGLEKGVVRALEALADPGSFTAKYGLKPGTPVLLYAMGDGNHSLATAKAIWEKTKEAATDRTAILSSPLRYALVELVNLHDEALSFEPIHRVLFDTAPGRYLLEEMKVFYRGRYSFEPASDFGAMKAAVDGRRRRAPSDRCHPGRRVRGHRGRVPGFQPPRRDPAEFPGRLLKTKGASGIDYVHGTDAVDQAGEQSGEPGLLSSGHGQGPAVPDRHPGRGPAPQDLLHGRGLGEAVLHGGPEAVLDDRLNRRPSAGATRHNGPPPSRSP